MTRSRERAREGVEHTERASQALDGIGESIAVINDMNQQIARSTHEQAEVTREVVQQRIRALHVGVPS